MGDPVASGLMVGLRWVAWGIWGGLGIGLVIAVRELVFRR